MERGKEGIVLNSIYPYLICSRRANFAMNLYINLDQSLSTNGMTTILSMVVVKSLGWVESRVCGRVASSVEV